MPTERDSLASSATSRVLTPRMLAGSILIPFLVTILTAAAPAIAQPIRLIHRWSPGEPTRYELTESMRQEITGPNSASLDWKRNITYTERVVDETERGIRIERTFDRVTVAVARDGEPPEIYDSVRPDPQATASMLIAPFIGFHSKSVRLTINDDGTVTDIEGASEVLDAVFSPFEGSQLLGGGVSGARQSTDRDRRIARQIEQALRMIPGRAVRPGERWPVEIDHESPLSGDLS